MGVRIRHRYNVQCFKECACPHKKDDAPVWQVGVTRNHRRCAHDVKRSLCALTRLLLPMALHVAYGPRGVKKLCASLSDGSEGLASNLLTLNGLLSNQETKMEALQNDGVVVTVLTNLLASTEAEVRRQAALAIASLTLVYQGRIAAADALTVAALCGPLREDRDDEVRAACASALESLTSSRDGCSVVMDADAIVSKLTEALDDAHAPVLPPTIAALANMLRLDLGVDEALGAGVVEKLAKLVDPSQRDAKLLETSLQALWNLANTPNGKTAAIKAGLLDVLAVQMRHAYPNVRRLAAGCVMAITIDKDGKLGSLPCVEPLAEMLFDPTVDSSAVRDAVGAIKNMSEYPKVRKSVDTWAKKHSAHDAMAQVFNEPLYDHKQWPASIRFQHQNVAPGGAAAADEAATRERWGYPKPFAA